jgi:hypothetical protein
MTVDLAMLKNLVGTRMVCFKIAMPKLRYSHCSLTVSRMRLQSANDDTHARCRGITTSGLTLCHQVVRDASANDPTALWHPYR